MVAKIIILNGVSSAGKTTLARAIQQTAPDAWLHVSMDAFIAMLPDGRESAADWFPVAHVERSGETLPQITNGPSGEALLRAMRQLVERLALAGFNIVVDEVAGEVAITDYRRRLGAACLVVKIDAPLMELERRERERGDRLIGLAREQSARIHKGISYDLKVDTNAHDPATLASRILASLAL